MKRESGTRAREDGMLCARARAKAVVPCLSICIPFNFECISRTPPECFPAHPDIALHPTGNLDPLSSAFI